MNRLGPVWGRLIEIGLGGGVALILVALVGMLVKFRSVHVVEEVLALSRLVWFGALFVVGIRAAAAVAATKVGEPGAVGLPARLMAGAVAGSVAAACLAALALAGLANGPALRSIFVNATADLFRSLSFDAGAVGALLGIGAGALLGAAGAASTALAARWRGALLTATLAILALGTLQNLVRVLFLRLGGWVETIYGLLYGRQGLSLEGAATIVSVALAWALLGHRVRRRVVARVETLPARTRRRLEVGTTTLRYTVAAAVVLLLPTVGGPYLTSVLLLEGLYVLMGLGLNIVVGYAGLLDLGYVAFFAIGAYTVGFLTSRNGAFAALRGESGALGFWQALPLAIAISIMAGVALGIPVLKTHGDYLAIITLGFGEIIGKLAISVWLSPWIGGAQGIQQIPVALNLPRMELPLLGTFVPTLETSFYYPIVVACAAATYVAWRMKNSRFGRAWTAVREDEQVAAALGVDLVQSKLLAFATGAALAGVSGAFFASRLQSVFPHSFGLLISINALVLIIVGGMGSIPGVYLGALVLVGLPELLREFSDFRMLLYGAILVFMMLKRPEGLWPSQLARRELRAAKADSSSGIPP